MGRPLTPRDTLWLARMLVVLAAASVLRQAPLPWLVRAVERRTGEPRARADVGRVVWLAQGLLGRLYRRDFCLPRSLVLFHFLSGWGYPVRLLFGVRKGGAALTGHAWVEVAGAPFEEAYDPRALYHVTYSYPPTP